MLLLIAILSVVLCLISVIDIRTRTIPNRLVVAVFALSIIYAWLDGSANQSVFWHALSMAYVIVISLVLFGFRVWGGGDAKLMMALSPLAVPQTLLLLFFLISLIGLLQGIAIFAARRLGPDRAHLPGVPYGVAISGGSILFMVLDFGYSI